MVRNTWITYLLFFRNFPEHGQDTPAPHRQNVQNKSFAILDGDCILNKINNFSTLYYISCEDYLSILCIILLYI